MNFQQPEIPQDRPARPEQQYGFELETFLEDQWPYLLGIVIVLVIFFYARYRWEKRHKRE